MVVLVGLAAIGVYYTSAETGGRAFILALATTVALGVPVALARRTLTATAETIAALGLLLVLLDGYVAYAADLAGVASVPGPLYAAVLFALVALVAAAYRLATHLRAPQFAALLAVQPLLPLIAVQLELGRTGFAAVFAGCGRAESGGGQAAAPLPERTGPDHSRGSGNRVAGVAAAGSRVSLAADAAGARLGPRRIVADDGRRARRCGSPARGNHRAGNTRVARPGDRRRRRRDRGSAVRPPADSPAGHRRGDGRGHRVP